MSSPFCQFYKKIVLRLNEHGDVIETQTITIVPPQNFLANLVSGNQYSRRVDADVTFCMQILSLICRGVLRATLITLCPCM